MESNSITEFPFSSSSIAGTIFVMEFDSIDAPEEETGRIVTTPEHYAFIKIAEGCDNRCSYCVIPSLRGKFRSRHYGIIVVGESLGMVGLI